MAKNGQVVIDRGTLRTGVPRKRFDEVSRLFEWILDADSDGIIFDLAANLLCIFDI